ncbi:MAG: UvrD-helicase domain-containing protein [Kiritimatiellae bacterium]|nr:UvrD-helicase domain-containing protein [Kiritimatiellia bacterium]MDD5520642.1 UvrD-helicase domain-containing protein [Kiritimatiellia bacterium]
MNINKPGHLAISASAGSGKTTRLAHRYISLLADPKRQVTPNRICAMTFTRKAAGEIFDRIADNLRRAASEKSFSTEYLKMPNRTQKDFLKLLRLFLDNLHRVNIGTMDSFIVSVAKAFPLELGIPMDFQVADVDGAAANENRKTVLATLLMPSVIKHSIQKNFLEAFKLATFGQEEKNFGDLLDRFITSYHTKYQLCHDAARWGNEEIIWAGKGYPWKSAGDKLNTYRDTALRWIDSRKSMADKDYLKFLNQLEDTVHALANYGPTTPWNEAFDSTTGGRVIEQILKEESEKLLIKYGKKEYEIDHDAAKAIGKLVYNLAAIETDRALKRTKGIYELLSYYDMAYEEITRQTGRFSFSDLQYLLAFGDRAGKGPRISRNSGSAEKLYIDFRMDSRLDHWLLDEFQDTSDMQWMIFTNLIDELIQGSPDGDERSFFYVGDVKQAIYRWRGGDQELFHEILDEFENIRLETMAKTYRCSPPVIDAVNQVFSTLPDNLPGKVIDKWKRVWEKHETHKKTQPGYATIIEPLHTKENTSIEARFDLVADLLNEVQPLKRELGVGILVRTNNTGSELVTALRNKCPTMNFVHEGKSGIVNNELAQALLSLVKLAAHPGDEFAWKHIQMTPFAQILSEKKINRFNISTLLLQEIENGGFQTFVDNWGNLLCLVNELDEYGQECLSRLEHAAAEYDTTGQRNCNSFLSFMNAYEIHELASHSSVRIMTIHQAKGLEFDIVILPELQDGKTNMIKAEPPDLLSAGRSSAPDWILKPPKRIIMEHDPVLNKQVEESNEDNCFDLLCLTYVAMTRARHALYIVTSRQNPESSLTYRPSRFIKQQLTGEIEPESEPNIKINGKPYVRLYPSKPGGENWYESGWPSRKEGKHVVAQTKTSVKNRKSTRTILKRSEPSKQVTFVQKAAALFDSVNHDVRYFGSAIHELLEKIEWYDNKTDTEKIINKWVPSVECSEQVYRDVCTQFRNTLKSKEVQRALSRPGENADVRREWRFDIILNKEWVSGAFDRVIIINDGKGKPTSATIMDYKSDQIEATESDIKKTERKHRNQMETYRRALSGILNLPQDKIKLQILLTRIQRVLVLD